MPPPRSRSPVSPMSPPPPFSAEFRSPSAAAPLPPPGPPLSHELVRHLREQQVLRLAAVSRALHHQLRYLHHGSAGGGGATSPGLYGPPLHRHHHHLDAGLLLGGAGAAASYSLHDSIMPGAGGFHSAAELALTAGRDSPAGSDVSNDNVSGMYVALLPVMLRDHSFDTETEAKPSRIRPRPT